MNRRWVVTIGVTLGIVAAMTWRLTRKFETAKPVKPVRFSLPGIVVKPLPTMSPVEVKTVKENAWSKAIERLNAADRTALAQIDKSLEVIQQFFEERKKNSPAFAQELLGLRGKWELVKSYLPGQDKENYHRYLHGKFEACFFKGSDIKDILAAAVATHLSALDGIENQLLVDLRADIEDLHPGATIAIPDAQSAIAFAAGYRAAKADVTPLLTQALKISAAQEVVSFIAGDIASRLAVRVVSAVATRLGIGAGILSSGAAASAIVSDKNPYFAKQLRDAEPATRDLVTSILLDQWPNQAAVVDFGIDTQTHYEALYYPIRNQEISPKQLDETLGFGEKITALVKDAPSNPHKAIEFQTAWDLMHRPIESLPRKVKAVEEKAIKDRPRNWERER